jgi:hypothetical protein
MRMNRPSPRPSRTRVGGVAVALAGVALLAVVLLSSAPSLTAGSGTQPSVPVVSVHSVPGERSTAISAQPAVTIWRIKVSETGLVSGTTWYASCNGTTKHSVTGLITFQVPNGTYTWSILNVTGYTVDPLSGSTTIHNNNVTVVVTFTSTSHAAGGLLSKYWWAAAAGGVILLLIVVVLVIRWRRKKSPPAAEWTPPPAAPEAESPPLPPPPEGATTDAAANPPPPTSGPSP